MFISQIADPEISEAKWDNIIHYHHDYTENKSDIE